MIHKSLFLFLTILTISLVSQSGCSQEDSNVSGVITLDGQPLENAKVEFLPTSESGRIANGRTKSDGNFKLTTMKTASVLPGDYRVKITTSMTTGTSDADLKVMPERVPAKFNKRTELTRTVKEGPNQFDFELLSK